MRLRDKCLSLILSEEIPSSAVVIIQLLHKDVRTYQLAAYVALW